MKENILVTGGFGFIGGHLVDYLTKRYSTSRVHVVDNLSSSPIPLKTLLKELGPRPNLSYDICSIEEFYEKPLNTKWDKIYHLASVVGPAGVLPHAGRIVRSIVNDTYYLIDIAMKHGSRLLDVSTSEVYGGGQEGCCKESFAKIIPAKTSVRLEYAVAKLAGETALINMTKVSPLEAVIVRPFNVAGPRQSGRGGFVLPRFISLALKNEPITVFGSGNQIRSFTHVKDVVKGIGAAMERGENGQAYNIGSSNNKTSVDNLADMVLKITGSKSKKMYIDPKTIYGSLYEEANDKYPDSSRATRELSWIPEFTIEETIEDTYHYIKSLDEDLFLLISGLGPKDLHV